jgi:hypothetical protein
VIPNAGPGLDDHSRVYFFGRVGASMPRPMANTILGRKFGWYRHVQDGPGMTPPDRVVGSNFTDGAMFNGGSFTLRFAQLGWTAPPPNAYSGRRVFPRNLECDFSGTLVADPHPLWGVLFWLLPLYGGISGAYSVDGYASNPWFGSWNHEQPPTSVRLWNTLPLSPNDLLSDNQALYHNKGATPLHRTWWSERSPPLLPAETYVLAGHLNPPMTVPAPASGGSWLLQAYGVAPFGPFGTCSGSTLTFGSWCFNDAPVGCPDTIPEIPGESDLGRRFNLEPQVGAGDPRNLQTYLQIFPSQPPEEPMSSGGAANFEFAVRAVREMAERLERGGSRQ